MSFLRQAALRGYTPTAQPVLSAASVDSNIGRGRCLVSCCNKSGLANGTSSARTQYNYHTASENSGSFNRRLVTSSVFLCLASSALGLEKVSYAEEVQAAEEKMGPSVIESVFSFFDSEGTTKSGRKLPKAYIQNAKEVVRTLRESLGDDTTSFGKKADTAKQAVRTYLLNWRGSKTVETEESYAALERALRALGGFYSKNGPNAILPKDVKIPILAELDIAEAAL